MLKNFLAPYYKVKSLTTVLLFIIVIVYITLACRFPPFLRIPTFQLEPLILRPEHLKHFEFYRIITAQFVFQDITSLLIGMAFIWSLGSWAEHMLGWKMLITFTSLSGLVGYSNSWTIPTFLIGCFFAFFLMWWPDPQTPIMYRKITLISFFIISLVYFLIFLSYEHNLKLSIYSASIYVNFNLNKGFLLTFIFGTSKDTQNLTNFRKSMKLVCSISLIAITSAMVINLIFYRTTLV
jgi:membrane associated rhomboid family serine protease